MSWATKVGDVVGGTGDIVVADGKLLRVGAVIIRRSRLRRARRFGWREVPTPDGRPIEAGCVMVERDRPLSNVQHS